jgi:hypothetical protein
MELLQWWNLIFVLPFFGAMFYVFLLALGLVHLEHDIALEVDHDVGFEHEAGIEHTAEVGHDGDHGVSHPTEQGIFIRVLSFFGIGRVPLSIIIISFCIIWGFSGWVSNKVFSAVYLPGFLFVWISVAIALICSLSMTKFLASILAKIMPSTETYAVSEADFVGRTAQAISIVNETFGQAGLTDDSGNFHTVVCRVQAGQKEIPKGEDVVLMFYDKERSLFYVNSDSPPSLSTG